MSGLTMRFPGAKDSGRGCMGGFGLGPGGVRVWKIKIIKLAG